jgi:polysaccharide export outer membrane protein
MTCLTIGFMLGVMGWSAGADGLAQYRLAVGDKIAITVAGQNDLSGEFSIDGAGYIQMALIGAVPLATLTLDECQQRITARLENQLIKRPVVSVRINEFRPVYVIGDVQKPGAYPFRFGLRLLPAIGLAGGFERNSLTGISDITAILTAIERVETVSAARSAAIIRLARVKSERAAEKTIALPDLETIQGDSAQIATFIKNEELQLITALEAHDDAVELLQRQRPRLQQQMQATQDEIEATKRQLEAIKGFLERYAKLSDAGYARRLTELDLQRQEAQQQASIHRLQSELSRLEGVSGDLDIRIEEMKRTRQTRLINELREMGARVIELNVAFRSAQRMVKLLRERTSVPKMTENFDADYELTLTRFGQGQPSDPVTAAKDTLLNPGDIVEVRRKSSPNSLDPQASRLEIDKDIALTDVAPSGPRVGASKKTAEEFAATFQE